MVGKVLVSFLGRPGRGQYERTIYKLDGDEYPGDTFALAVLSRWQPERVIFLGTAGSGWDVLPRSWDRGNLCERVLAAVKDGHMTKALLQELEPAVATALEIPVTLRLIPSGRNFDEQLDILAILEGALREAGSLDAGQDVVLDVTHGFRHLPLLGFLSAWYLEQVRHIRIDAIYYGALEMREQGRTPVLGLHGLRNLLDWVNALARFDEDGNIGVFVPLLSGLDETPALKEGAFRERIQDIPGAVQLLQHFREVNAGRALPDAGKLMTEEFQRRLAWVDEPSFARRHRVLAEHFRDRGDYLRATIYLFEAFVSRLTEKAGKDPANPKCRREMHKQFERQHPAPKTPEDAFSAPMWQYWLLCNLRNVLAHSAQSDRPGVGERMTSQERFQGTLEELFAWEAAIPDRDLLAEEES